MRKIFLEKIKNALIVKKKSYFLFLLIILVFFGAIFFVSPALALSDVGSFVADVLGWIIMQLVSMLGKILTWVIDLLVQVAQYNTFINAPAVSKGWLIVRDVCNMFFIALLLVIAFGTVLGVEKYSYKRTLGALLIAAVVINFSKFICGFFIDLAQILMLTFVRAFSSAASGNFIRMLGMDKWLNLSGATANMGTSVLTGAFFALVLVIISLIVIGVMMVILAFRIVMLWLLVVLSPLAFVLNVIPGKMKTYSSMWWQKFTSYLIVGPVMAFFIWLSFSVAEQSSIIPNDSPIENTSGGGEVNLEEARVSEAANPSNFAKFVVSISMLIGSLLIAQQLGVAGGKLAGKAVGEIQAYGTGKKGVVKRVKTKAEGVGKGVAGVATRPMLHGLKTGRDLVGKGIGKGAKGIDASLFKGKIGEGLDSLKKKGADRKKRLAEGKGDFWDYVSNDIVQGWRASGNKERAEGQVKQTQRVKETTERISNYDNERLFALAQTGNNSEKIAAGRLLIARKQLKSKEGDANFERDQKVINSIRQASKWNKPLQKNLDDAMKKNVSTNLLVATQFNNLERKSDQDAFLKAIENGEIKIYDVISKLTQGQIKKLQEGAGGKALFSEFILNSLADEKEAAELKRKLKLTNKEDRIDEVFGEQTEFKNDEERRKYILAGGSLTNVLKGRSDDEKANFIGRKENEDLFNRENIREDDLRNKDTVRLLNSNLSTDLIINLSTDKKDKKIISEKILEIIKENNKKGDYDTTETKKLRKNYIRLNKDKLGERGKFNKLYEGAENEEDVTKSIKAQIEAGEIKSEYLIKIRLEDLRSRSELTESIALKLDFKQFKELYAQNSMVAREIIGKVKELAQGGDSKMNSLLEDVKHSIQMAYLVDD